MHDRGELPPWGARARRAFELCSLPVALAVGANALHAMDVLPGIGSRPVAIVLLVVLSVAVAGFAVGGLLWLAAEVATGFREPS